MLNSMIQWSLANRATVIVVALLILGAGLYTATRLPVEVLPDLTKPTVTILTEAPGLAPEEVETRITRPIENALMGVTGLARLRSNSDVALSLVFAEFDWNTDVQRARVLVQERLQAAREQLPEDVQPYMTPVASLMGEILIVGVRSTIKEGEPDYISPREVRTIADWTIRPRLQSIPGIAEILNMGGGVSRIEIQPDPFRMQALGVTLDELSTAAAEAAGNTTGGFIDQGTTEIMVRNLAMTIDLDEIGKTAIKNVEGRTISIADVAEVVWGIEPMRGDATVSVSPEKTPTYGVAMSVTKAPGFDTRTLTEQIRKALDELAPSLPHGVETTLLFQQKTFIDHAIGNLVEAIRDGAVMVTVVLFLFLLNLRTTFITLMAMPISFAITMLVFAGMGISVNSMTLGGLAVAIGMVVDDAIVDVENVHRRLGEWARGMLGSAVHKAGHGGEALHQDSMLTRRSVISSASMEVRNSILYATVLIILVFLPLLGLSGIEGKLFAPIAIATIISMIASFIVSLTVIPVLCSYLLHMKVGKEHGDGRVVRLMKWLLDVTLLRLALERPWLVLTGSLALLLGALMLYPEMNKDFLPKFREETALVAATAAPGTSLNEMNRISDSIESQILSVPEVKKVGRRVGRAERGDHVVPVSTVEFDVDFTVEEGGRDRKTVLEDIGIKARSVPGIFAAVSGPLADRIGHMLSGVAAPVAVKIFGPDLDMLRKLGEEVRDVAKTIPGFENAKLDIQSSVPQLRIEPDRDRTRAYGIAPGKLNEELSTWIGGKQVAELRDGHRTVSLIVRLPAALRGTPEKIASLPILVGEERYVPLNRIADVREAKGPNAIMRENAQRRYVIAIQPTARDVTNLAERLRQEVTEKVSLPEGYFVSFEGEFQAQQDATRRIAIASIGVFVIVFMMLRSFFGSASLAFQVLMNIPLSLMGGLAYTWLKVDNISIATLVGFIAVGGVAARNGIMMLSHYLHLMKHEGEGFTSTMIARGTEERLVPVLMTALSAGIGLIPLVLAADQPGKEILHPVAVVIVGGLVSATLLNMAVTPAMFVLFGRKAAARALADNAPATR